MDGLTAGAILVAAGDTAVVTEGNSETGAKLEVLLGVPILSTVKGPELFWLKG